VKTHLQLKINNNKIINNTCHAHLGCSMKVIFHCLQLSIIFSCIRFLNIFIVQNGFLQVGHVHYSGDVEGCIILKRVMEVDTLCRTVYYHGNRPA
jgi:hypothetical protein